MIYPELYVGIDISKLKHDVVIVNEDQQRIGRAFVIAEERKGYGLLTDKLDALQHKHQTQRFLIGLEATSEYWKNLHHFLVQQSAAFLVTALNPIQTRRWVEADLRRAKTDPIDAKDIACFMAVKKPEPSFVRPPALELIKDIDRQIYSFKKQNTMTVNKLRLELAKVAPEIERAIPSLTAQQVLALLQHYPTAEAITTASQAELRQIRYGKKQWRLPINFINKMKSLAENSIAYQTGPSAGTIVQALIERIVQGQHVIDSLKAKINEMYATVKERPSLLTTIKGISPETAIILEAYIGDINRFSNAKKIVAFFGMNPTVNKSGKSQKRESRLQKKGSGIVRHKLFMAMLNIIRHKIDPFYSYYKRLVDSGKPKLVAIAAAMRKLLVICYTILKNQQSFDPKKCSS